MIPNRPTPDRGPYTFGGQSNGPLGLYVSFSNGSATVVSPAWEPLVVASTIGIHSAVQGDGLVLTDDVDLDMELQGNFRHSYGRTITVGYTRNGGDIITIGSVVCNSNDYIHAETRRANSGKSGDVLLFFITSDFEFAATEWSDVNIVGLTKP